MRWQLSGRARLHWRHLDGDWLIFDEASGQTLAADAVGAAALMALEEGIARSPAEIEQQVVGDLELDDTQALAALPERLAETLKFLAGLGLVESLA